MCSLFWFAQILRIDLNALAYCVHERCVYIVLFLICNQINRLYANFTECNSPHERFQMKTVKFSVSIFMCRLATMSFRIRWWFLIAVLFQFFKQIKFPNVLRCKWYINRSELSMFCYVMACYSQFKTVLQITVLMTFIELVLIQLIHWTGKRVFHFFYDFHYRISSMINSWNFIQKNAFCLLHVA